MTDLGVPRSDGPGGWLGKAPLVVVSVDVTDLRTSEFQQEVLELRRRVKKLANLLRLTARTELPHGAAGLSGHRPDPLAHRHAELLMNQRIHRRRPMRRKVLRDCDGYTVG